MATTNFGRRAIALAGGAVFVAGCAAPRLAAEWVDPQLGTTPSLRGATVLVACEAYESVVTRICQDQLASEVVARGATPVFAPSIGNAAGRPIPDEQYLPAARAAGAKAILATFVAATGSGVSPGFSLGIGGVSFGGGTGVGVGVSAPIGGGQITTGYSANSRITDVASGRLMWSAKATTPPSGDVNSQLADLAKTVLGSAEKAGLF